MLINRMYQKDTGHILHFHPHIMLFSLQQYYSQHQRGLLVHTQPQSRLLNTNVEIKDVVGDERGEIFERPLAQKS